ncbi:hypothetical protein KIN_24290 [Litoreibacter roseus]|uniref:Uncharacterized protein n=1 Tax=Litoreibacter roseus TaxID=2601869 RepID=A0A6N6JGW7_9RHOB|nr:hypothetical protein KIN_24290 [Litoreibacter roseus]
MIITTDIDVGRTRQLVPKEQPPRKLSGQRTDIADKTLERGAKAPAEGIAISGERTEGAPRARGLRAIGAV